MYIPVTRLLPGDLIVTDQNDITVVDVEDLPRCDTVYPSVRVTGRITRGHGRGPDVLSWTYRADHVVDIDRPEQMSVRSVAEFLYQVGPGLGWKDERS